MADNGKANDPETHDPLLAVQMEAIDRLSAIGRQMLVSDPSAGGSTDVYIKTLVMRAEISAMLQLLIRAGVFPYEEYVAMFVDEAKDLGDGYLRDSVQPSGAPKLTIVN